LTNPLTPDSRKQAYPAASSILFNMTNFVHQDNLKVPFLLTGLPRHAFAYGNSWFCILKFTKPAHEHHLQTTPTLRQALFSYIMTVSRPLSLTAANTLV